MHMKKYYFVLLLISCTFSLFAQEDRFTSASQTVGKEIYISDNSVLDVAFGIVDGKVKPIKKLKNFDITMKGKVYAVENSLYNYKKDSYIILKSTGETILFKEQDAPLYLSSFISKTYWQEKYDSYKSNYVYLNFKKYDQVHSKNASVEYDDLSRIEWRRLEITDNGAIYYLSEYNGASPLEQFKVTSKFFEESKDFYFIKKDDIQPYIDKYNARLAKEKREKEIADSIGDSKIRLAIALEDASYKDDDRTIEVAKGDTLAIFSYNASDDKYVARFHFANLLFKSQTIEFIDTKTTTKEGEYSWERKTIKSSEDANYLKSRGDEGREQRFLIALEYDNVQTKIWIDRLNSEIDEYNREVAYKKKNQIFITRIGYAYDDNEYSHQFGMKFGVYNCFNKTIKYVEFTMTNYNAVGDVQRDDFGHSSKTVKGIGPIAPEDGGTYVFDDVFWDDRDVIEKTRLVNVKFIFTDGTTKVFSGYANVKKHMTANAWD